MVGSTVPKPSVGRLSPSRPRVARLSERPERQANPVKNGDGHTKALVDNRHHSIWFLIVRTVYSRAALRGQVSDR